MRKSVFAAAMVFISLVLHAQLPVTTTLAEQTANNTSAADAFTGQSNGNLGANNVSKLPIRSLLYSGSTTKIYAHVEPWWGSGSHVDIGYSSQDPAQVHRQVQDMVSRGIDGVVVDWYGPGSYEDTGVKLLLNEAAVTPNFSVLVEIDVGAVNWHSCYPTCNATTAVVNLLTAANAAFFSSPAIATSNGRPLLMEFGMETLALPAGADAGWNVIDWGAVQTQVPGNLAIVHRNLGGYAKAQSTAAFIWMEPVGRTNFTAGFDGLPDLDWFYSNSVSNYGSMPAYGAVWKGFNDTIADWSGDRHIDQNCGQTWLRTFAAINQHYSVSNQLPAMQLVTWNDYEEGTEVETGIDNCLNLTATASGAQLQWNPGGDESTLDHYTVYASTDGQKLATLGDFDTSTHALDLSKVSIPAGSYQLFVQAVGKPTIRNQMSAAVSYTIAPPPTSGPGTSTGSGSAGSGSTTGTGSGSGSSTGGTTTVAKNVSLSAAPPVQSVKKGDAGRYTLTVKQVGANDPVQLSCSGLPVGMSCSFSATTVTPGANGTDVQLTVNTATQTARSGNPAPVFAALFSSIGLLGFAGRSRSRKFAIGIVLLAILLTQVACGGGTMTSNSSTSATTVTAAPVATTTPSTTYSITVNAVSGSVTRSTVVTLTVE